MPLFYFTKLTKNVDNCKFAKTCIYYILFFLQYLLYFVWIKSATRIVAKLFLIIKLNLERAMGIEPTSQAWEARILPMYYARKSPNQSNLIFVNQFIQKTIMKFAIFQWMFFQCSNKCQTAFLNCFWACNVFFVALCIHFMKSKIFKSKPSESL